MNFGGGQMQYGQPIDNNFGGQQFNNQPYQNPTYNNNQNMYGNNGNQY